MKYSKSRILIIAIITLSFFTGIIGCKQPSKKKNSAGLNIEYQKINKDKYRLIILAGQSNMVGAGSKQDIEMPAVSENIEYYNFGKGMDLKKASDNSFGPEVGIMEELSKHFPKEKFLLIKYAIGGASMYGWSPERDEEKVKEMGYPRFGKMSDSLFKYTSRAIKDKQVIPTAFVWMQGETDARFIKAGEEYASNFSKLIDAVRKECKTENLPIIFGKVNPTPKRYIGLAGLQESQNYVNDHVQDTYLVDTEGLEKRSDSLHYSSLGQLELGHRFGKILVDLIK